jgi:hypothetical protein
MRLTVRVSPLAALLAGSIAATAVAQAPAPEPTPAAAPPVSVPAPAPTPAAAPAVVAPAPTPLSAMRIADPGVVSIARLPAENPFGGTATAPAALPAKLSFADGAVSSAFFVSAHVDPTGKVVSVRRERDPIPSVSAEALKSFSRWTFSPARRGGQATDTWGAYRVEMYVEIRAPKILQMGFTPITPTTPIPAPLAWGTDNDWLESRRPQALTDGTVPIDQVDTAPLPQKTPWSADSYKGPFSVKFWVHVDRAGHADRAIPLEASDPILLSYFRRSMSAWVIRPAQGSGGPVESWNELTLGGQISYSSEIKQIAALRRPIGP